MWGPTVVVQRRRGTRRLLAPENCGGPCTQTYPSDRRPGRTAYPWGRRWTEGRPRGPALCYYPPPGAGAPPSTPVADSHRAIINMARAGPGASVGRTRPGSTSTRGADRGPGRSSRTFPNLAAWGTVTRRSFTGARSLRAAGPLVCGPRAGAGSPASAPPGRTPKGAAADGPTVWQRLAGAKPGHPPGTREHYPTLRRGH